MAIEADTKDWTWVLVRACPQCGFDTRAIRFSDVPQLLRRSAARFAEALERDEAGRNEATRRPDDATWSTLEYAAHVRDVFGVFADRVALMLSEQSVAFTDWDQDAAAVAGRYNEQEPLIVAREVVVAADTMASVLEAVTDRQMARTGRRSDGKEFTVDSLSRYLAHDVAHHAWDISR